MFTTLVETKKKKKKKKKKNLQKIAVVMFDNNFCKSIQTEIITKDKKNEKQK